MAALFVCTVGLATPASAHSGDESYLILSVTENSMVGRAELPFTDLRGVLGLTLEGDDDAKLDELEANQSIIVDYLDEHLDIGVGEASWPIVFDDIELFFSEAEEDDGNYIVVPFEVEADRPVPRTFDVRFDVFVEEVDGRQNLLLIENDWQAGVIENGWDSLAIFNAGTPVVEADLGSPNALSNLWSSIKLGINHIETGPDHILFVLVLLLPSVLVWGASGWNPADNFGAALWRILTIVTMFTVAHSITFSLAGLGFLPLPSPRIVESIIALSIGAAALHNLRPIAPNREWLLSFVFGLFHGMGFASLVSGLEVDRGTQLVSLLGRNIGIEIGQAAVVIILFPALFLLRRLVAYRPIFVAVSLILAVVAVGWGIERAIGVDESAVDPFVDPVFVYPRIFFVVAAITAIAAVLYQRAASAGQLLPTHGEVTGESSTSDASAVPEAAGR
jgi:hypothetical protein